jgi:IPT/TIG domain
VTIKGSGFTGVTDVEFSHAPASFTVINDTTIEAVAPPSGANIPTVVDVQALVPGVGVSVISNADKYSYSEPDPSVTAVTPSTGYAGTPVVITGTGFCSIANPVTSVSFGGQDSQVFHVLDDSHITADASYGNRVPVTRLGGTVPVQVVQFNGTIASTVPFTYLPAPDVTGLSPSSGPEAGGTTVDIHGVHFTGATSVSFDTIPAASFTVNSDTDITAVTASALLNSGPESGSESVNVYVTGPGLYNDTNGIETAATYTYNPAPPRIDIIDPPTGATEGGNTVQITGAGFAGPHNEPHVVSAVSFGGVPATSFKVIDDSHLSAVVPPHAHGSVDVTATSAIGTSATSVWDLYDFGPAPTVTHLSPAAGVPGGGNIVVITGTGFLPGTSVMFGSTRARSVTYITTRRPPNYYDPDHLKVVVPPGGQGQVDVHVTNSNGSSPLSSLDTYWYAPALAPHNVPTWLAAAPGRSGAAATATSLLHNGGLTLGLHPAGPGTAAVNWYAHPGHGHPASEASASKGILVAAGRQRFAGRAAGLIKIRLTAAGKRLLSAGKALPITSTATFTPRNGTSISATKHVVLKP